MGFGCGCATNGTPFLCGFLGPLEATHSGLPCRILLIGLVAEKSRLNFRDFLVALKSVLFMVKHEVLERVCEVWCSWTSHRLTRVGALASAPLRRRELVPLYRHNHHWLVESNNNSGREEHGACS